jgi:site-specific DNA-methyltransferase (adenine-specific)/site-specific DNA-methyltransferase (cytosine-N4-specific)
VKRQGKIIVGDALAVLASMKSGSVQAIITSPPYWGQRDYGIAGQIGAEPSPDAYLRDLVAVLSQARRVLADDGVLWLNVGDKYATKGAPGTLVGSTLQGSQRNQKAARGQKPGRTPMTEAGIRQKELIGLPWMLAFALRADGWMIRSDVIWAKLNPQPESVDDRPTQSHEHVFLLTKSDAYHYDCDAIREPHVDRRTNKKGVTSFRVQGDIRPRGLDRYYHPKGRNRRSVWPIAVSHNTDSQHSAVMPLELARLCVLSGSKPGSVVLDPFCGSGTTGIAAMAAGRDFIGVELAAKSAHDAVRRIRDDQPLFNEVTLSFHSMSEKRSRSHA